MNPKTLVPSAVFSNNFREMMKGINTSIPGHFIIFSDGDLQRAQVQIGVERVDINGATFAPPPIIDVPVLFPGGKFLLEYQLEYGDEGLIFFSQRCVDGWKQTGKIGQNPIGRFFEKQDAFFIPGFRPQSSAIQGYSNNGIRIRNQDGSQFVWLKNDGSIHLENQSGHIKILANGTVDINGVTFSTDAKVKGKVIEGTENVVFGSISGKDHKHSGVQHGNETSNGPV